VKFPVEHIYLILVAFLAVLGCFTAAALVGVDATVIGTLRDVLMGLAGALGGVAVAHNLTK
jgi:hypothetical protein